MTQSARNYDVSKRVAQGHILSRYVDTDGVHDFMLRLGTPIQPAKLQGDVVCFDKPWPVYRGSARIEGVTHKDGSQGPSLYAYFIRDHGFVPCTFEIQGTTILWDGVPKTFGQKAGSLFLAALVRYAPSGRPEVRIIMREASNEVKAHSNWKRQPITVRGTNRAERIRFVKDLVASTRRKDEPLVVTMATIDSQTIMAEVEEMDPFE